MAKNYYFDLAAILGVEIDEVFKISNKKNTYYISEEKGLVRVDERGYEYHGLNVAETLAMLFSGQLVVEMLAFHSERWSILLIIQALTSKVFKKPRGEWKRHRLYVISFRDVL